MLPTQPNFNAAFLQAVNECHLDMIQYFLNYFSINSNLNFSAALRVASYQDEISVIELITQKVPRNLLTFSDEDLNLIMETALKHAGSPLIRFLIDYFKLKLNDQRIKSELHSSLAELMINKNLTRSKCLSG